MSELWELIGNSWRLPLDVEFFDDLASVQLSEIPLLNKQHSAALSLLAPVMFLRGGKTWVCRADLVRVAHRSERTNPEDVVEWLPERGPVETAPFKENDFIKAYAGSQYAITRDPVIADALWGSFCKFMLHWLINEEREVSFGFARIIPIFLRKNWSNAAAKFERRNINTILKSNFLKPDIDSMIERGVGDYLVSDDVTAFDPDAKVLRPVLEVVPGLAYYDASARRECARKRAWTSKRYWKIMFERLKKQLPVVLEIYEHHLKEAKYPHCSVSKGYGRSSKDKRTGTPYSCQGKEAVGHWGEDDILFPAPYVSREPGAVQCEDGGLSGVSNIQPG